MASVFTPSLRLALPTNGTEAGTWGNTVNNGLTSLVDTALAGTATITMTTADYTLSTANGAADEARAMFIKAVGSPAAARNIICPALSKLYFVFNNTTGGFAQTFKTAAGAGVSVPNGSYAALYCNGTNVVDAITVFNGTASNASQLLGATWASPGTIGSTTPNTGAFAAASSTPALKVTQTGAGNSFVVEDSARPDSTPFVIDATGKVVAGHTSTLTFGGSAYLTEVLGLGAYFPLMVGYTGANSGGAKLPLVKNRSADWSTHTLVQNGDLLGVIEFQGDDGTQTVAGANIYAVVEGTPGAGDMPTRLVFSTTPDGGAAPSERMRIDSAGSIGIGNTPISGYRVNLSGTAYGSTATGDCVGTQTVNPAVSAASHTAFSTFNNVSAGNLPILRHFFAGQGTFTGTVDFQYGFQVSSGLTGAGTNYGFYSNIPAGTGRYNFYAAGTASNYMAGALEVAGALTKGTVPVVAVVPSTSGNVLTSNGTAWVSSAPAVSTGLPIVNVSGTTQTAVSGNHYVLNNVAATAVTAPTPVAGAQLMITPNNGLFTNTVDFGANTCSGPAGTATGVITLNAGATMQLVALDSTTWRMT